MNSLMQHAKIFRQFRLGDALDPDVELENLNHIGIKGISHKRSANYTTEISVSQMEGECSTRKLMKRGVLQVSILGPRLFLCF